MTRTSTAWPDENRDAAVRILCRHWAAIGRDRNLVGQHAVFVVENFQRARVFGLGWRAFVAAHDQDGEPVVRRHAYLVGVNAEVQILCLFDFVAQRRIRIDAVDVQRARVVECNQHVFRWNIGGHVDGAHRQRNRLAMRLQRAACRIYAESAHMVVGAGRAGARRAAARRNIKMAARRVRPRVMHACRQSHALALGQHATFNIDFIARKFGAHACVQRYFAHLADLINIRRPGMTLLLYESGMGDGGMGNG
ncbi:MAG: hypothetical protein NTW47_15805 [Proteobacteria bacterium]|nr:hypothetical protein [Pseudomonadota bacterium]